MPILERRPHSRLNPDSLIFEPYRSDVASQDGEDGILARLFTLIEPTTRYCVEFGAWDGKKYSNTWNFLNNHGWRGALIEGDKERFGELQTAYADRSKDIKLINCFVGLEGAIRLDSLLTEAGAPKDFDLLSIDIDGNDWHIWHSFTAFRPKAVIIEFNPTADNDVVFVQDFDFELNQGCSLLALIELGKQKGYELAATTNINAIFVDKPLFEKLGIADNHIDSLYDPKFTTKLLHGYDGTFFAAGCTRVIWHNIGLQHEDYQVLPAEMRKFPERKV